MSDPEVQARRLAFGAVDVLPAGDLASQLGRDRPLRVKLGIDPTAPDIHLGHVVVLHKLSQFQAEGHTVVLIIGDYTARVGDPSGRSTVRPVLSDEQIEANARTFTDQAFRVLDRERTEIRFNSEWLAMSSAELFDLVRRFTVARLLERDDFTRRMAAAEPISALELIYPILQGYDSVAVGADVEVGGTDQKFNLLFGREVQESYGRPPQLVITLPILPGTDGHRRMGKSLGNYIAITEDPAEMFGKLMSVPDGAMPLYWQLLLGEELEPGRHPARAKREMARRLVDRFAGEGAGARAEARFDEIHVRREVPEDVPTVELESGSEAIHMPAFLAAQFGISTTEARRLIKQGAVKIDGRTLSDGRLDLGPEELGGQVVQVGKRRFVRVAPRA